MQKICATIPSLTYSGPLIPTVLTGRPFAFLLRSLVHRLQHSRGGVATVLGGNL